MRIPAALSSSSLALLSALAIVLILLFAHWERQATAYDSQAYRVAYKIHQSLKAEAAKQQTAPGAPLTYGPPPANGAEMAQRLGIILPDGIQTEIITDVLEPDLWEVSVWRPDGIRRYVANPEGVTEELR